MDLRVVCQKNVANKKNAPGLFISSHMGKLQALMLMLLISFPAMFHATGVDLIILPRYLTVDLAHKIVPPQLAHK